MFKTNRLIFREASREAIASTQSIDMVEMDKKVNGAEGIAEKKETILAKINEITSKRDLTNTEKLNRLKKVKSILEPYKTAYGEIRSNGMYSSYERRMQHALAEISKITDKIDEEIRKLEQPARAEVKEQTRKEAQRLKAETPRPKIEKTNNDLGLTVQEERLLARYKFWKMEKANALIQNRTWPHRLEDHEIILRNLMDQNQKPTNAISNLQDVFFPSGTEKPYFVDIGPAIGGFSHGSKPAQTLQEMAEGFPDMECYALDLPEQYDILSGKTPKSKAGYEIDPKNRKEILEKKNIHFISGDGLKSIKDQIADSSTNPYPEREKTPSIPKNAPVFIRAVNSIDICCDWENYPDGSPGVKTALLKIAQDFQSNPVMLFFNEQILIKPQGTTNWTIVGHISPMGFDHKYASHNRQGQPPYTLNPRKIDNAISKNKPMSYKPLDKEASL